VLGWAGLTPCAGSPTHRQQAPLDPSDTNSPHTSAGHGGCSDNDDKQPACDSALARAEGGAACGLRGVIQPPEAAPSGYF